MQTLTIRSGSAALVASVSGAGTPVVFLHAGVADRRSFAPAVAALGDGFRALAYDRRGFGDTEYTPEPHAHVDDLFAVLDAVGPGPAVLVGNSQGGRIAIDATLERPERVRALVLVAPAVSGAPEPDAIPDAERRLDDAIEAADAAGDLDELNRLEAMVWLDGVTSAEGRVGGEARDLFLAMNGRALAATDPGPAREPPSAWDRLGELAVPALAMVGDLDLPSCVDACRRIADRAPRCELLIVPGVAHVPQLERPDEFNRTVRAFLVRHDIPSS